MRKDDVRWYHENAGPLSLAVQCDDRFPWGFDLAFSANMKKEHSCDYYSHHLHPQRYTGARIPKKVYDVLRLHCLVWYFLRHVAAQASRGIFRYALLAAVPAVFVVLVALLYLSLVAFVLLFALCVCATCLASIWYYVRLPQNWKYLFDDRASIEALISNAKAEFQKRGLTYPTVIRHGWNLPWADSMQFYIKIGVIADASAVPIGFDKHPRRNGRHIEWNEFQPYVASLTRDYNVMWDRENAAEKGLLELPVNLGNIANYGFGDAQKRFIETIPDGGLVSCYLHPQDDCTAVRDWVTYLKHNYDVQFVSAEQAATFYEAALTNYAGDTK